MARAVISRLKFRAPFSHKNGAHQSLMVTDGAWKLNYTSVLFFDPGVQIDET